MAATYEKKDGESISKARGRYIRLNYNQDSSGFWLNKEQLLKLAEDLGEDDDVGIGFMVGAHPRDEDSTKDWFSVEIVPLKQTSKNIPWPIGQPLNDNFIIANNGIINTNLPILHNTENSYEGQHFPPPYPED